MSVRIAMKASAPAKRDREPEGDSPRKRSKDMGDRAHTARAGEQQRAELELQDRVCKRYLHLNGFRACFVCIARKGDGDECRFKGIRYVHYKSVNGMKCFGHYSYVHAGQPGVRDVQEAFDYPSVWNQRLEPQHVRDLKLAITHALLPTLEEEQAALANLQPLARAMEQNCRPTCDGCVTSVFCGSWMCVLCGREMCEDCYARIKQQLPEKLEDSCNGKKNPLNVKNYPADHKSVMICFNKTVHAAADFRRLSRFAPAPLQAAVEEMCQIRDAAEAAAKLAKDGLASAGTPTQDMSLPGLPQPAAASSSMSTPPASVQESPPPLVTQPAPTSQSSIPPVPSSAASPAPLPDNNPSTSAEEADLRLGPLSPLSALSDDLDADEDSPSHLATHSATLVDDSARSTPLDATSASSSSTSAGATNTSSPPTTPAGSADELSPSFDSSTPVDLTGLPSHPTTTYADDDPAFNESLFREKWAQGSPLVVTGLLDKFKLKWTPAFFVEQYGAQECKILDCQTEAVEDKTVADFFGAFGEQRAADGPALKLKDWPPQTDFKSAFPPLYEDFERTVPVPSYARRDGVLNIASHFPKNAIAPDLGPKMYNAFASTEDAGSFGSTRLHMDVADAVNIMLFAEHPRGSSASAVRPCAAWDIFRVDDAAKIREFLSERFTGLPPGSDPIHAQAYYLDAALRRELYETKQVISHRIYQEPGQAVFIPAGCAHQVCNLADCIKVAADFVSPENIARCAALTQEFRALNFAVHWKEDVLQLRRMMWHAWESCSRDVAALGDAEMAEAEAGASA